jgi:hypothetical protein
MKYLSTYLAVLFFAAFVVLSMTQMTNDTHEIKIARTLSRLFAGAFVFNLAASITFWLQVSLPPLPGAFVMGHVALAAFGALWLRKVCKDVPSEDAAPHSV